ncbi:MAG TPA: glycosyltransferase [Chitinophaga sp.]
MKEEIKVSIIIATWNAAALLPECLAGIAALQLPGLEIVVVDGGSKDHTVAILEAFKAAPLRWVSEQDRGIYDALNKGVRMARGKWVYFMGADDRLLPGFRTLYGQLQDERTVYYGNTVPIYGKAKPSYDLIVGKFTPWRLAKYCMNHQQIIYPAAVFKQYQYDLRYKVYADYALNLRVWGDKTFQKKHFVIDIAGYFMSGFSASNDDTLFKKDKPRLIRESMGYWMYLRFLYKRFKKQRLQGQPDYY